MRVEKLEQVAALIVASGLVTGNLLLFTPLRKGHDPRERVRGRSGAVVDSVAVSAHQSLKVGLPRFHRQDD